LGFAASTSGEVWLRSIWSYVGLGVALFVAALLIVPGFLDWSRYAGLIEAQAEAITGRDVEIAGDVRISILPSPTLTLGKMTIANAPGASGPHMLEIKSMTAELAVASLFRGDLEVSRLSMDAPTLWLEETPEGRGNWQFAADKPDDAAPDGEAAAVSTDAALDMPPVTVGEIAISSGRIAFRNLGIGTDFELSGIDALIGAESLLGPYRAKGTARMGDQSADFVATLGEVSPDKAYSAKLSFTSKKAEAAFQGIITGRGADIRFDGAVSAGAAADITPALGAMTAGQPISMTAGIVAAPSGVTLREIEAEAGAIKVSGNIAATSGPSFTVDVGLNANRIDFTGFDTAGISLDAAAIEAAIQHVIDEAPAGTYALAADEIWLPEGKLETAAVTAETGGGTVSVSYLSARLPGDTNFTASGAVSSGEEGPYFSGEVAVTGADARGAAVWLGGGKVPHALSAMPLKGLRAQSSVFLTPQRIALDRLEMTVDGGRVAGRVSSTFDKRPTVAVTLTADAIALPATGLPLVDQVVPGRAIDFGFDGEVELDIAHLEVGGVQMKKLSMDLIAQGPEVTLRELLFESALGAKATLSGVSTADAGRYQATLTARDVASLDGLVPLPARSRASTMAHLTPFSVSGQALWPTEVVLESAVGGAAETVAVSMLGRIDTVRIEVEGEVAPGYEGLDDAAYDITAVFEADEWAGLAQLAGSVFGITGDLPADGVPSADSKSAGPQTITAAFQGVRGQPMILAAEAATDVIDGSIAGQLDIAPADPSLKLQLKADISDPTSLAAVLRYPLHGISRVEIDTDLSLDGGTYTTSNGLLRIAGDDGVLDAGVSGTIGFETSPPSGVVSLSSRQTDLELVTGLLTGAYITPDAEGDANAPRDVGAWSAGLLNTGWLQSATLDINVTGGGVAVAGMHADQLAMTGTLRDGRLTIAEARGTVFGGELRGSGFLAAESGLTLEADIAARGFDAAEAVGVFGFGDFATGTADFDMSVKGNGLSALALVSSLTGQGSLMARDGTLVGLDVAALSDGLSQLERIEDFEPLADATLNRGTTAYAQLEGRLAMTAGVLRAPDIRMDIDAAKGRTAAFADFGRKALDVEIGIDLKKPARAPEALVVFAGDFAKPKRAVNTVDLEAFAARQLLNQEIDALGVDAPEELRVILDLPDLPDAENATP